MWHFWIDVGGTFTDCLAQAPDGQLRQTKVLSSGTSKGRIRLTDFSDPARIGEPNGFWNSARLDLIDDSNQVLSFATVTRFESDSGKFILDRDIRGFVDSGQEEVSYELNADQHAPLMAMRKLIGLPIGKPLPQCTVHLGTTRGTNALLTRSGSRTALVTSRGLKDFLTIGDQARPHLFELAVRRPEPLFETSIEICERVLSDGSVEQRPDEQSVRQQLLALQEQGIDSVAVCLIHGYRYPDHEKLVGRIARQIGFIDVRLSHEVSPLIKLIPRGETTVLDAYLNPVIGRYLDEIEAELSDDSQLMLMTSAGGLVPRERFSGKDSVLSGPAGGVVGAARVGAQFGFSKVIGFDMGGTSTDVSRCELVDGRALFQREYESYKAGVRIMTPMLEIETVAAGGGSICWFDGTKLRVGPDSAGADPGPACYGKGGPLAVTDMNLVLGRILEEQFPFPLDRAAVDRELERLCMQLNEAGFNYSFVELAEGFVRIANHSMAEAISTVSVAKGYDPTDHVLISFGGAGSQHCCRVAENLGMRTILDHPQSSILSAVGIRLADRISHATRSLAEVWDDQFVTKVESQFVELTSKTIQQLLEENVSRESISIRRRLDMRFQGTDHFMTIDQPHDDDYKSCFLREHQKLYGYVQDRDVEVIALRVEAISSGNRLISVEVPEHFTLRKPDRFQGIYVDGNLVDAALFNRHDISTGDLIVGPSIVADAHSTTIVDAGWTSKAIGDGTLLIERTAGIDKPRSSDIQTTLSPDPIQLEIFNRHFSSIAKQMGIALKLTSVSVNVKERLDFSCAIFTAAGDLVVNAPHIPVHLGAMSETVREVIRRNAKVSAGDVFVTNDPYAGGSHLPDITVVSPVFDATETELLFWVASRSHHAEIGGKAPGSMPANAKWLVEEGVLIENFKLVDAGKERFGQLRDVLLAPPFPTRNVEENLADLAAQVAANRSGARDLLKLVESYSAKIVLSYMGFIQQAAERKARAAIADLPDEEMQFSDQLDNGATISITMRKVNDSLTIDFSDTNSVTRDNLNANRAVVSSAVMYVVRCLVAEDIPLNEGLLAPVSIVLPECLLNPRVGDQHPKNSPALVGGNVETSQRVVDVLLGALGIAAASQGTMNNWLIGDQTFGYYETVGGGAGATKHFPGASAIHTHMTNTRLTDPEILETRYPCVLREFSIRLGSGGSGNHDGGCGMIRDVEFTRSVTLSLLTGRRNSSPYGLGGGKEGVSGVNKLIDSRGNAKELLWRCERQIKPGDRLRLETPGGGGFGFQK